MASTFIELIVSHFPKSVNTQGTIFKSIFGDVDAVPLSPVVISSDVNTGAVANELEFVDKKVDELVTCLSVDLGSGTFFEDLIFAFVNLAKGSSAEADASLLARFKALVTQRGNTRRTTRWAIKDAARCLISDPNGVKIVEWFDYQTLYFQVRFSAAYGAEYQTDRMYVDQEYIDQSYITGPSSGVFTVYAEDIIGRAKAAGVDFDILFIKTEGAVSLNVTARIA